MNPVIVVKCDGRSVKVRADSDGTVDEITLKHAFQLNPDAYIGLSRNDVFLKCRVNGNTTIFELEPDWNGAEFELFWKEARRSRQNTQTPGALDIKRIEKITNGWEERVFMITGEKSQGSAVLISDKQILTAAHMCFKLHESYNIRGTKNRSLNVTCEFINKKYGFAILKSEDLPDVGTAMDDFTRGNKFYVMGYPQGTNNPVPSISRGMIESFEDAKIYSLGSPGFVRGLLGAPVFNHFGHLTGILVGGEPASTMDTTIRECLESSAEQKYAHILGMIVISFCRESGQSDTES